MTEHKKCSALRSNPYRCINGFPVSAACAGIPTIPICCKEDITGRLFNQNGGRPKPLGEASGEIGRGME